MYNELCEKCGISAVNNKSTQAFGLENSEWNNCLAEKRSAEFCELYELFLVI